MKRYSVLTVTFLLAITVQGQDYYEQFKKLFAEKDTIRQRNLLEEWQKKNGNDPELFTSYFNFYVRKSMHEVIRLDNSPGPGENLTVLDSAKKEKVGYIYSETQYNPHYLDLGFEMIDRGIEKFPNRLDMRFGKIHILGQAGDFNSFSDEIVRTIDYSIINNNKWEWTLNDPVKDGKDFLLDNIQTYVNNLFNGGDAQAKNIRKIAQTTLKNYPGHVVSLSNLAISYILENEYSKALESLLMAEERAPEDAIILGNIAYIYVQLNAKGKAIPYYEKVLDFGNDDEKRFAEQQLKKLRQ